MNKRSVFLFIVTVLLLWLGWSAWGLFGRSYEQQVLDAQDAFLRKVERRDWEGVKEMLTLDYMDELGHDRDTAVEDGRQALAHFFTLTLTHDVTKLQAVKDLGMVQARLRMEGTGAGFSHTVMSMVNGLEEPWIFHWQKKGRWPWDWRIVQIHHDHIMNLRVPAGL